MAETGTAADAAELAARIERMLRGEAFTRTMNVRLVEGREGYAVLDMAVTDDLANDKGICHGGALFTFADLAFGAAALYGGRVVTADTSFHFLRPGRRGSTLRATAVQTARTRRTGLFQIVVTDQDGLTVAAGQFKGQWLAEGWKP